MIIQFKIFIHMATKTNRRVKLQGKYRATARGWIGEKQVPWLNISGIWLEQAGFRTGQQVEIRIGYNQLIITNALADGTA